MAESLPWIETNRAYQFFLYLHLMEPHTPYAPLDRHFSAGEFTTTEELGISSLNVADLHSSETIKRKSVNRYDDEIRWIDQQLNRIFQRMDDLDLWDNTLLIITADHGEEFYDHEQVGHGRTMYQASIHVPLILFFPQGEYGGTVVEERVDLLDIAPTLYDYFSIVPDCELDGSSLLPLMSGNPEEYVQAKGDYFGELTWKVARNNDVYTVISGNFKYIETIHKKPELSVDVALFDLSVDPHEQTDVSHEYPQLLRDLANKLANYKAHCDSLYIDQSGAEKIKLGPEQLELLRTLGYIY
jgi:arylsulfatase A-like enzyme